MTVRLSDMVPGTLWGLAGTGFSYLCLSTREIRSQVEVTWFVTSEDWSGIETGTYNVNMREDAILDTWLRPVGVKS